MAQVGEEPRELVTADAIGDPAVLTIAPQTWWVTAPIYEGGAWHCRRFRIGPSGLESLPDAPVERLAPASPATSPPPLAGGIGRVILQRSRDGIVYLALTLAHGQTSRAHLFRCDDASAEPVLTTSEGLHARRPALVVLGDQPILAYDAWDGQAYHVYVQCGDQRVKLSESPGWHIRPDIVADGERTVWLTWLRTTDVMDPQGVVDSRCEVMAGCLRLNGDRPHFQPIGAVDDMSHGLLDLSPDPRGVWGYLGRRRHPMLLRTPAGVLVLWEQKRVHDGKTRENVGVLWGRRLAESGIGEAQARAKGAMAYTVRGSRVADDDRFEICCLEGWHVDERHITFQQASSTPLDEQRLPRDAWRGWKSITLPRDPVPPRLRGGHRGGADRPSITLNGTTYHLYWLDPHCHTCISADAEGELDELYRYARHKAGLDAVVMSDNDYYLLPLTRSEWRQVCAAADAFNEPGAFVALPGYEWTCRREFEGKLPPDHRTIILPGPTDDIVRWNEVDGDYRALYEFTQRHGGIVHAHHQGWRLLGDAVEANIEATSSWDVYLEADVSCFHEHLLKGHKIGVFGGSDSHRRNPGLGGAVTGVWAESLTREGILEALRSHRCYATSGQRVMIDFRANDQPMGCVLQADSVDLTVRVASAVPILSVELIRDGETAREWNVDGETELAAEHREPVTEGDHFYYLRVILEGALYLRRQGMPANLMPASGPRAWSSPIWVTRANDG